jgi:hypothetical protein
LPDLLQTWQGLPGASRLDIGPPYASDRERHTIREIGLLTDGTRPFEEWEGVIKPALAEIEAGKTATGLIQTERVISQFCYPDGLLPVADAVVKLPLLGQGLDQAMTEDCTGESGPEICLRWESSERVERLGEERDCGWIRPQEVVRITQVELGGHPQHHILVDQSKGPLAEDHRLFGVAREP